MDETTMIVIDNEGNEVTMEILFTFKDDNYGKEYVLYINPEDEDGEVYVSSYTEEGELLDITDEQEWDMIEEVFNAFILKHDEDLVH
ncbi:hypothetical protein AOC36_06010 [Erysipelothrix larvae]|uniref:UPF0473 protein AOC36_06010 n=1 Tax=Erysipelothrix larvae TaxID=1514105 RepID=A0A0X8GZZ5_9FIRM|nr:DUF1292 domain-containing protein [Erysipelothrix larvae]AMC93552.1 hypothetical protein AOC36_06010 [Erysipelothrix larvae]